MDILWSFLYIALDVFPFLPLMYYALAMNLDRARILRGMIASTVLMVTQSTAFAIVYQTNATNLQLQLTLRELFAVTYLLPLIVFLRVPVRKAIFVFCVILPASLFTISLSYLPSYLPNASFLYTHPCMEEVMLRAALIPIVSALLFLFIKRILRPAMNIASTQVWSRIWLIPLFLTSLSLLFTHHYFRTDFYILYVILRLFVTGGCLLCSSVLLQSLTYMEEYTAARAENEQSKRLLAIQEEQYRIVTRNIAQTRALRHDLRHQLFMIRNLTADQKYDQLIEFVDSCTAAPTLNVEMTVCDNYVVNGVATYYLAIAREKGIDVSLAIAPLGESLPISDTDLCILIGNSMENAIEACLRLPDGEKTIALSIKLLADNLIMTIDNSYDGEICRDGDRFISKKREGKQEGIGIRSIRSIAEKHKGDIRIEYTDKLFMLSVFLPLGGA